MFQDATKPIVQQYKNNNRHCWKVDGGVISAVIYRTPRRIFGNDKDSNSEIKISGRTRNRLSLSTLFLEIWGIIIERFFENMWERSSTRGLHFKAFSFAFSRLTQNCWAPSANSSCDIMRSRREACLHRQRYYSGSTIQQPCEACCRLTLFRKQ